MGFTLTTHAQRKTRGGTVAMVATNPYCRIAANGETYFLQNGQFWSEGGQLIEKPPEWAIKQADALVAKVKKEVGWGVQNLNDQDERGVPRSQQVDPDQPMVAPVGTGNPPDPARPPPANTEMVPGPEEFESSEEDLDAMTVEQLRAYAADHNIDITGLTLKSDIREAIDDAQE